MSEISEFLKERLRTFNLPPQDTTDFVYDDGGMYASGEGFVDPTPKRIKKGKVYREEVMAFDHIRAIAIATGLSWKEVRERYRNFKDGTKITSHAVVVKGFIEDELGWEWTPVMKVGSGCTMHTVKKELPKGSLILRCSKYYMASINGVIHDTFNNTRKGKRAVYGYWEGSFFTPENYKLITGERL